MEGLRAVDENGRIIVKYKDVFQLDMAALVDAICNRFFEPESEARKPENVIQLKEKENGTTGRTDEQQARGHQDADREGIRGDGGGAEGNGKESRREPGEAGE